MGYGSVKTKIIALFLTCMAMLYPMLTLETLKLLPCRTLGEGTCPRKFMIMDYDIECWRDVRHVQIFWGIAMPMLFMFVLGIPAIILASVLYHRDRMDEKKTHVRLNAIMAGYKIDRKWWGVVVMLRKALFISTGLFLKDFGSMVQIFGGVFVIAVFTYLHFVSDPYITLVSGRDAITSEYTDSKKSDILHKMEGSNLMVEMLTLYSMLLFTDAAVGSSYKIKQGVGVAMFFVNILHMSWLLLCLVMRAHREKKIGKKADKAIMMTLKLTDKTKRKWKRISFLKILKKASRFIGLRVGLVKSPK